jgi:hypothetical protein
MEGERAKSLIVKDGLKDKSLTLSELESHLWESANILRGPVDAADFHTSSVKDLLIIY